MDTVLALVFTVLWASASIAIKFGLQNGPPLVLANLRFVMAGLLLAGWMTLRRQAWWPAREWWGPLSLVGLLNTTIYLGATFVALQSVSAGLFTLFIACNPFLVALMARGWLHEPVSRARWSGMTLALVGLAIGSWAGVHQGHSTWSGIALGWLGLIAMAVGSVYFQARQIRLPGLVINTWQLLLGALFLIPFTVWYGAGQPVHWTLAWWGALLWLVGAVSIGAMLIWFRLLHTGGAARASLWLFLTPVVGYGLAALFLHEPVTWQDGLAALFVMAGLLVAEREAVLTGLGPTSAAAE